MRLRLKVQIVRIQVPVKVIFCHPARGAYEGRVFAFATPATILLLPCGASLGRRFGSVG